MLWTILTLLAIPFALYLYSELTAIYKIFRYKKQGIKYTRYLPLPITFYFMGQALKSDDIYTTVKTEMKDQDPNQPFNVMNVGSKCFLTLISEKAVKEFYAKETEVTIKQSFLDQIKFLGFFFENGKEVQEKRAIFSKIFHYSNVVNLFPIIREVVRLHVRKLRKRAEAEGGQVKIDLKKEFSSELFNDLSACILFRGAENKLAETFEGLNATLLIQKMFNVFIQSQFNIMNQLPFATALGLNKELKELIRLQKGLQGIIKKEYNKRYNQESLDDKTVLDIMVKLNKDSERETGKPKFTINEISSNFEIFQFAASDTSFQLSSTTLTYLALPENQQYQKRMQTQLDSELGDSYSNDELTSMKEVDLIFKEAARLATPASLISRAVTKDFKLAGYQVYKGDEIRSCLINYQPEYYKDPYKFNPDRFDSKSAGFKRAPKVKHIPFSLGQRACLGKYLGEMMVKIVLAELLKEFEVSVEDGFVMKFSQDPLYGVANPDLIMKVRRAD